MRNLLLALAVLLAPLSARADQITRLPQRTPSGSIYLLNAVASNASAGARTATFTTGGYSKLTISFSYVRVGTPSALTMTCKASTDKGIIYNAIPDQTINAGVGTLIAHTWFYPVAATDGVTIDIGTGTYDAVQCVFSATGGGATDLLTVSAIAGAP